MMRDATKDSVVGPASVIDERSSDAACQEPWLRVADRFLRLLDPHADSWHFRTFPDAGSGRGKNYTGALDAVATDLRLDNGNGRGVFVVIGDGGGKDAEIVRIRAVFADFDKIDAMPGKFDLEPHAIIESSPGKFHVYWLVDGLEVAAFKQAQQAIAARYGSDPSVCNSSRVMRLPGFVHHKGEPFQTRIIHESGKSPYTAADVLAALPEPTATPPRQEHAMDAGERVVSEERHGDLLKLAARFARQVHFEGLGSEAALAALFAEAERGRWTRNVPVDEIRRAFDGALDKCRRGEWSQADKLQPDAISGDPPQSQLIEVEVGNLLAAEVTAPRFVAAPIIPRGVVTLLGGHGGAGKSTLALIFCAHAACGAAWAAVPFEQGKAVFVSLEDPGTLVRYRLRSIVEVYGLDMALIERNLRIIDGADIDAALVTEVSELGTRKLRPTPIMAELQTAVADADLIVIDNASDTFDGDENNRRQVRFFLRLLGQTARTNDAGLMLLAHIDKNAALHGSRGNSYSGSTAWHNSARSRLALLHGSDGIELRHEKANFSRCAKPIQLAWSAGRAGSGVLIPSTVDPAAQQATIAQRTHDDAIALLKLLRIAAGAGVQVPTATSGPKTTSHALASLPEMPAVFRNKEGRRRLDAAFLQLTRDGFICRSTFTTASRNTRELWELTQAGIDKSATAGALDPHTPSVTNARAEALVSPVCSPGTHATHATHARGGFDFSPDRAPILSTFDRQRVTT